MVQSQSEVVWLFGIGANMNIEHLEKQKGVKVLDHSPAKVRGWAMTFTAKLADFVEPAMASASPIEGAEVHGVAYSTSKEHAAIIDEKEGVNIGFHKVH